MLSRWQDERLMTSRDGPASGVTWRSPEAGGRPASLPSGPVLGQWWLYPPWSGLNAVPGVTDGTGREFVPVRIVTAMAGCSGRGGVRQHGQGESLTRRNNLETNT